MDRMKRSLERSNLHKARVARWVGLAALGSVVVLLGSRPAWAVEPCNPDLIGSDVSDCDTPRLGTVSGFYLAFDLGIVTPKATTVRRIDIGPGPAVQVRLGSSSGTS
jgi:hypothetical protein